MFYIDDDDDDDEYFIDIMCRFSFRAFTVSYRVFRMACINVEKNLYIL